MITLTIILSAFIIRKITRAKLAMAKVESFRRITPARTHKDIYTF